MLTQYNTNTAKWCWCIIWTLFCVSLWLAIVIMLTDQRTMPFTLVLCVNFSGLHTTLTLNKSNTYDVDWPGLIALHRGQPHQCIYSHDGWLWMLLQPGSDKSQWICKENLHDYMKGVDELTPASSSLASLILGMGTLGMTKKCTGACGFISLNAKHWQKHIYVKQHNL